MRLTAGTRVGPYEVVALLGAGGMAEVYLAKDTRLGRDVALKVVSEALGTYGPALERFQREARLAASLSHPNVVALYDVGSHDGQPYLVTELLQGQSLRERLSQGPVPVQAALEWAAQASHGLSAVHARGIVHRDLKPDNLFIASGGHLKLLDFGIAKHVALAQHRRAPHGLMDETHSASGSTTATGTLVGTPGYMAPEQVRGDPVDARADVFSLGAVLYEMLSGQRAFPGSSLVESGYAALQREPDPLPSTIPTQVVQVVRQSLEKDPSRRFQSADELGQALARTLQYLPDLAGIEGAGPSAEREEALARTVASRGDSRIAPSRTRLVLGTVALVVLAAAVVVLWRLRSADYFWRDPLASAQFHRVTEFEGTEHSAAISRDGRLAAFLSSHDGPVSVFVTQIGTGTSHNVTRGRVPEELINREIRTLGFSPDGARVHFWVGKSDASARKISIWSVPTLGGEPSIYREDVAELDWSPDGHRLVYHRPGAGDPTFVESDGGEPRPIYYAGTPQAPSHAHFPTWSPDGSFIYFVQGNMPDGPQDLWRIASTGGPAERITFHSSRVSYPTFLDRSTLLYLATAPDGSGPWIYGLDVERRIPHRIFRGVERYTSLAASADGSRLVATSATQFRTSLWRVPLGQRIAVAADASRIAQGRSPTLAAGYLFYVTSDGTADRIWKRVGETATELWTASGARVIGGPVAALKGGRIAFSVEDRGKTRLVVMNADGTGLRTVADSMQLRGAPAWSPDGESIVTAVNQPGGPRLFRISASTGEAVRITDEYALDPAWAPTGDFVVYSGTDPGTQFSVRAVTPDGRPYRIPQLTLTRVGSLGVSRAGARRLRFIPGQAELVALRGGTEHKNLWVFDLTTGTNRQLTNFGRDIIIGDFDVSPDAREIVFERVEDNSDVWLIDRRAE